jgi:pilus assembly protein CpaF
VLEELLGLDGVTDVLVNGPGVVWIERRGRLEPTDVRVDRAQIHRAIERLVAPLGLRADRAHPIVDARRPDGARVSVVLPPLAVDGPLLALRHHGAAAVPLESLAGPEVAAQLRSLLSARRNLVVFGPTGSGKTTLLNALLGELDPWERVVTIEDVAELRLGGEHVVRLESRPGAADGAGRVEIRDLVRAALRLRPDRIVVGEVRGAEALDMVWALSTGHDGGCSTCHARSADDALERLVTMCLSADAKLPAEAVRRQVRDAVDVLIGVGRAPGGGRQVRSVHEVHPGGTRCAWSSDSADGAR